MPPCTKKTSPVMSQSSIASPATSGEMLAGSHVSKTDASDGATT